MGPKRKLNAINMEGGLSHIVTSIEIKYWPTEEGKTYVLQVHFVPLLGIAIMYAVTEIMGEGYWDRVLMQNGWVCAILGAELSPHTKIDLPRCSRQGSLEPTLDNICATSPKYPFGSVLLDGHGSHCQRSHVDLVCKNVEAKNGVRNAREVLSEGDPYSIYICHYHVVINY